ncbi:transcriptional adapter ADA2a-like [Pyrus ussuriensis x Pyrus communis]|uniref:Transcriptional adapter ADA2a-like n=1 Tax=Pyrus ussuriensis x Pyrus communis TaxID=2448454 RepID=A0A5N5EX03_9ROSA|nr:transcriptional adapter ADA2a-like [Pyrus ussuriensis x Pyrus communis]
MEYELPCEGKLLHDLDALFADDLDALFAETTAFDPVTFLEDMGIDVHAMATTEKKKPVNPPQPKQCFGNGKELKMLLRMLDDLRALYADDLDALFAETMAFDPVTFLEGVGIDGQKKENGFRGGGGGGQRHSSESCGLRNQRTERGFLPLQLLHQVPEISLV